jgi:hypothetical protein
VHLLHRQIANLFILQFRFNSKQKSLRIIISRTQIITSNRFSLFSIYKQVQNSRSNYNFFTFIKNKQQWHHHYLHRSNNNDTIIINLNISSSISKPPKCYDNHHSSSCLNSLRSSQHIKMKYATVEDVMASFTHPVLPTVQGEPDYPTIHATRKFLQANSRAIKTHLGGGKLGHLGLIISDASYAMITPTTDAGPTLWTTPQAPGRAPSNTDGTAAQISAARHIWE